MDSYFLLNVGGALLTAGAVAWLRGRQFGMFTGVLLTMHTLVLLGLRDALDPLLPALAYLQGATFGHFLLLTRPRLRPLWYRALVSWPAHFWLAATFLAVPWAVAAAVGLPPVLWWLPFATALVGIVQSLRTDQEVVELVLDGRPVEGVQRVDAKRSRTEPADRDALRIVQITDPHLGPFMSEDRLRGICERAAQADPDLVLLTGDFFTMEGKGSAGSLGRALQPLLPLAGRTFACHGNHDLEDPRAVAAGLAAAGVRLLRDEWAAVETRRGPVQIVGLEHVWSRRDEHYAAVFERVPGPGDALRIVLLHDPGGFKHLPEGDALVLSGHTHGGHVGLVSLGLDWTSIGAMARMPDHGFWGRGTDRLYVHRANGHYGFPLRVGVPSEESVLRVRRG